MNNLLNYLINWVICRLLGCSSNTYILIEFEEHWCTRCGFAKHHNRWREGIF